MGRPPLATRPPPPPSMASLERFSEAARRLVCGPAASWRRQALAAAVLTSAAAVLFAFFPSANMPSLTTTETLSYATTSPPPPPPPPPAPGIALDFSPNSSFSTAITSPPYYPLPPPSPPPSPPPTAPPISPPFTPLTTTEPLSSATTPPPPPPPPAPEIAHDFSPNSSFSTAITSSPYFPPPPPPPPRPSSPPPTVPPISPLFTPDPSFSTAETPPPNNPPPPTSFTVNSYSKEVSQTGRDPKPPSPRELVWLAPRDRELLHAKSEIDGAPVVVDDPELYPPLFRNASVFKRSYELMERILKVYVYQDGAIPIFHKPELKGIYASEGWFMKLMEMNKKFVVKDPNKAHLFYLPYSARQLELALYVPDSHKLKPLALFLKNYVEMISTKYPFWNRTKGSDHFLVACHDWGPYTTTLHDELRKNTIKALCNADVSEGIFVRGKDVSLPETSIRVPKRPLRDVGGKPVSQRSILAFFAGNMHGRVRPILLKYWSGKDEDMKIYGPLPNRVAKRMSYIQHMKSSKFCICPMGYEVNSPRIVEAIYYECVPVIIADNFVPPFDEVLNWSAFSVIIAEKDIPNLKEILLGISLRQYISMQTNIKRLQKHFLWHARPVKYDIFHMILHSIWFNRLNQIHD